MKSFEENPDNFEPLSFEEYQEQADLNIETLEKELGIHNLSYREKWTTSKDDWWKVNPLSIRYKYVSYDKWFIATVPWTYRAQMINNYRRAKKKEAAREQAV